MNATIYQLREGSTLRGIAWSRANADSFAIDHGYSVKPVHPDISEAESLLLCAKNDYQLYQQAKCIIKNLARKMEKLQYSELRANALWKYLADATAKQYGQRTDVPTRCALALMLAQEYDTELCEA